MVVVVEGGGGAAATSLASAAESPEVQLKQRADGVKRLYGDVFSKVAKHARDYAASLEASRKHAAKLSEALLLMSELQPAEARFKLAAAHAAGHAASMHEADEAAAWGAEFVAPMGELVATHKARDLATVAAMKETNGKYVTSLQKRFEANLKMYRGGIDAYTAATERFTAVVARVDARRTEMRDHVDAIVDIRVGFVLQRYHAVQTRCQAARDRLGASTTALLSNLARTYEIDRLAAPDFTFDGELERELFGKPVREKSLSALSPRSSPGGGSGGGGGLDDSTDSDGGGGGTVLDKRTLKKQKKAAKAAAKGEKKRGGKAKRLTMMLGKSSKKLLGEHGHGHGHGHAEVGVGAAPSGRAPPPVPGHAPPPPSASASLGAVSPGYNDPEESTSPRPAGFGGGGGGGGGGGDGGGGAPDLNRAIQQNAAARQRQQQQQQQLDSGATIYKSYSAIADATAAAYVAGAVAENPAVSPRQLPAVPPQRSQQGTLHGRQLPVDDASKPRASSVGNTSPRKQGRLPSIPAAAAAALAGGGTGATTTGHGSPQPSGRVTPQDAEEAALYARLQSVVAGGGGGGRGGGGGGGGGGAAIAAADGSGHTVGGTPAVGDGPQDPQRGPGAGAGFDTLLNKKKTRLKLGKKNKQLESYITDLVVTSIADQKQERQRASSGVAAGRRKQPQPQPPGMAGGGGTGGGTQGAGALAAAVAASVAISADAGAGGDAGALPEGWEADATEQGDVYYCNVHTGATQWEAPVGPAPLL